MSADAFWGGLSLMAGLCIAQAVMAQPRDAAIPSTRQITISVGTPPGSPASLYAQLVSRHMGRYLDGNPAIIVQHMPGAGGLVAANAAYITMPNDGTALVTTNSTIFIEPLLGGKGAQFETRKFTWIGGTHVERMTCVTWHTSNVRTLQDAREHAAIIGSYGPDGPSAVFARAANKLAGTRFTLITGYSGGPAALIAMERGEVEGNCALGWHELSLRNAGWLRERKINILFQMGLTQEPELPGVPMLIDQARPGVDRKAMELLITPIEIGRPIYAPPGVDPRTVRVLRSALERALQDPQLLSEAGRSGLPVRHIPGEEIRKLLDEVYRSAPEILSRARAVME